MTTDKPDGERLTDAEREALVSRIKWNLDHCGPVLDDRTPYSRFESPAHAAADAVYDWLTARASTAQAEAGEVAVSEVERAYKRGHRDALMQVEHEAGEVARLRAQVAAVYALIGGPEPLIFLSDRPNKIVRATTRRRDLGCDVTESLVRESDIRAALGQANGDQP